MKAIYLASDSKARKQLLELFGLKFKIISSGIKEKIRPGNRSFAALVRANAVRKAKAVSKKVKTGIIISADTVVVEGKSIYGKPRNMADAHKMLKNLSGRPQWIYSGVCVLNKDTKKIKVACEKTKIFMDKLTDKEIDAYFKVVSPLDKAGSFDIQGKGAFFIRRIEGCFYNVVGLPLRKLYLMLKDMGIKVFTFSLVLWCTGALVLSTCGCSTEYNIVTGQEEKFYYSTEQEVRMGQNMAKEIEKRYKLFEDPLVQKRVQDIGGKIVAVCDRKDIDYHFKVLAEEETNAVSLPGGFIYINKGLIDRVKNDDELAGVIAHEVGHIVARHSIKKLQAVMGYSLFRIMSIAVPGSPELTNSADLAFTEILLGYGREDELLADRLAARYTKLAGFDPQGMVSFLSHLQESERYKPLRPKSYFKTHPYVPDRIRTVKQELGQGMGFTDYINIEEGKRD